MGEIPREFSTETVQSDVVIVEIPSVDSAVTVESIVTVDIPREVFAVAVQSDVVQPLQSQPQDSEEACHGPSAGVEVQGSLDSARS